MTASGGPDAVSVPVDPAPMEPESQRPVPEGRPGALGSYAGRARTFREQEVVRRREFRDRVEVVIVVMILALGILAIVTAHPFNPSSGSNIPTPGPPIVVNLTQTARGHVT